MSINFDDSLHSHHLILVRSLCNSGTFSLLHIMNEMSKLSCIDCHLYSRVLPNLDFFRSFISEIYLCKAASVH